MNQVDIFIRQYMEKKQGFVDDNLVIIINELSKYFGIPKFMVVNKLEELGYINKENYKDNNK